MIANNACKINRVARSILVAEVMALGDGVGLAQWLRAHWYEILYAEFAPHILYPSDQMPIRAPFNRAEEPRWVEKSRNFRESIRMVDVAQGIRTTTGLDADGW